MDANFWHDKWARNEIGFHGHRAHPMLVRHLDALALPPGGRVFLPLCGKTLDIHWLLAQGHRVAGAELSPLAVRQLFDELGVVPQVTEVTPMTPKTPLTQTGALTRHSARHIDIYVGDIFALSAAELGPVDAVYDRAAMVALPPEVRARYATHVALLTAHAPQLLITFDHDQAALSGPPFAVPQAEVARHHGQAFALRLLDSVAVPGGLKGQCPAQEEAWLLTPR